MIVEAEVKSALKDFDKFNKKLHYTKKQADPLTKAFSSMKAQLLGLAAGAVAFTTISNGIRGSIEAYKEQLTAELKLQSALKATGNAVGLTKEQLNDYAKELSQLTGISDESLTNAQAVMLTFTQIGKDVFPSAIRAAADMSTMFGNDLQSSVIQLGKALNDPIKGVGALGEVGISFNETQKEQIRLLQESGDIMGAQNVILDELNREFGGVAEKVGVAIGTYKSFGNAIGDSVEDFGFFLNKGLNPIVNALTDFISKTNEARRAQREFREAQKEVQDSEWENETDLLENLRVIHEGLNRQLQAEKKNIEQVIKENMGRALSEDNAAMIRLRGIEAEIRANEARMTSVARVVSTQQEELRVRKENEKTAQEQERIEKERAKAAKERIEKEYNEARNLVLQTLDAEKSALDKIQEKYDELATHPWADGELENQRLAAMELLKEKMWEAAQVETDWAEEASKAWSDEDQAFFDKIDAIEAQKNELSEYDKQVKEIQDSVAELQKIMGDWSGVTSSMNGVFNAWKQLQTNSLALYESRMQKQIDAAEEEAERELEIIEEKYDEQYEALKDALDNDVISREEYLERKAELDLAKQEQEAAANAETLRLEAELNKKKNEEGKKQFKIQKAVNIAEATMAGALAAVKALTLGPILGPIAAAMIAGLTSTQIGLINHQQYVPLAEGGITTGPTTALIGEGGEPEMVLPLSKAEEMGFGNSGQSINYIININGNAYGVRDIETHVFNGIQKAQKMNNLPRWSYVN